MAQPQLTVGKYNPGGYVPGGASPAVAAAIQKKAFTPYNPNAYVPGGASPAVAKQIQALGFGGATGPVVSMMYPPDGGLPSVSAGVHPTTPPISKPTVKNIFGDVRPDVSALISGDYSVQQAETDMASQMGKINDQFTQSVRQALIDLGVGDTSKIGQFGSYIDQDTLAQAIANKYSANAQITQQQQKQMGQTASALAARGILSSGQYTKNVGDINQQAEQNRYSALQSFLTSGQQGLGGIEDVRSQLLSGVAQARSSAADRAQMELTNWLNYQDELDRSQQAGSTATPPPPPASQPSLSPLAPYAVNVTANKTGASANKRQGIFSIH